MSESRTTLPEDTPIFVSGPNGHLVRLADGRVLRHGGVYTGPNVPAGWRMTIFFGPRGLKVMRSSDVTQHGRLMHVSISYDDHHPDWETIRLIRDALFPKRSDVMMVLPRDADYINIHEHTFHLWETPVEWGVR